MSNEYYDPGSVPAPSAPGSSAVIRQEYNEIGQGFDKLPVLAGNANKLVQVSAGANALVASPLVVENIANQTSPTGSLVTPAGTTVQRDLIPAEGYFRFNKDTHSFEGYVLGLWGAIAGTTGAQGPMGPQGVVGPTGATGATGSQGVAGPAGPAGATGPQGAEGPKGDQGVEGPIGPQGNDGTSTIIVGDFGATKVPPDLPPSGFIPANWDAPGVPANDLQFTIGQSAHYTGPNGPGYIAGDVYVFLSTSALPAGWSNIGNIRGPTGPVGPEGPQGIQGNVGPQGIQGPAGPQGATGPSGSNGTDGATGATGPQGDPGAQGPQGVQGLQGPQGTPGPVGMTWRGVWGSGISYNINDVMEYLGTSWIATASFISSTVPPAGGLYQIVAQAGAQGAQGIQGPQGAQGPQGDTGPAGPAGTTVASGVSFSPVGGVQATNVQAAIQELDGEKMKSISASTNNKVPQWDGITGNLLKDGLPVQTSATDATTGALLTVGAFGLGGLGAVYSTDLNTLTRTGFYSYQSSTLNLPPMGGWGTVIVHALDGSGDDFSQLAIQITGGLVGAAFRTSTNGVFSAWTQLLSTTGNAASATYAKQVPTVFGATSVTHANSGKALWIASNFTLNTADGMQSGDIITLVNSDTTPRTITQGAGMNQILAGVGGQATITLGPYAMATLWYVTTDSILISGAGLS
jgi:hypothetical protein